MRREKKKSTRKKTKKKNHPTGSLAASLPYPLFCSRSSSSSHSPLPLSARRFFSPALSFSLPFLFLVYIMYMQVCVCCVYVVVRLVAAGSCSPFFRSRFLSDSFRYIHVVTWIFFSLLFRFVGCRNRPRKNAHRKTETRPGQQTKLQKRKKEQIRENSRTPLQCLCIVCRFFV